MTSSSLNHEINEVDFALCRAMLYSALALGFHIPTDETIKRLGSEEGSEALGEAAQLLESYHGSDLCSAVRALNSKQQPLPVLLSSFARLFGHTARGAVSPYETEYGSEALFQQPHDLGDLQGFYLAFGLTLNAVEHERADHISCECEFLSFLAVKEAYALEKGDPSMLEVVRKATLLFLQDHLARFGPAFARKLSREDAGGFYGILGNLCLKFVTLECQRLNVPLGLESLELRPAMDDRIPMACGNGLECAALPGAFDPERLAED